MAAENITKAMTSEYPEPEDSENEAPVMAEDVAPDYITGHAVKDSPKERVRQRT
jgi:hypothetical protein